MEAGVYFTAGTSLCLSQCIYHVFVGGSSVASDYASATWLAKEGIQIASKVYLTPINGGTSSLDGTFMSNGDAALGGGGIGGFGRVSFESAGMLEVVGAALADIQLYGSDLVVSASGARPVWLNASLLDTAAIVTIATSNKAGSTILVGGSELVAAGDAFATASFHMSAAELDGILCAGILTIGGATTTAID